MMPAKHCQLGRRMASASANIPQEAWTYYNTNKETTSMWVFFSLGNLVLSFCLPGWLFLTYLTLCSSWRDLLQRVLLNNGWMADWRGRVTVSWLPLVEPRVLLDCGYAALSMQKHHWASLVLWPTSASAYLSQNSSLTREWEIIFPCNSSVRPKCKVPSEWPQLVNQHSLCFCQNNLDGSAEHPGSPAETHISPKTVLSWEYCIQQNILSLLVCLTLRVLLNLWVPLTILDVLLTFVVILFILLVAFLTFSSSSPSWSSSSLSWLSFSPSGPPHPPGSPHPLGPLHPPGPPHPLVLLLIVLVIFFNFLVVLPTLLAIHILLSTYIFLCDEKKEQPSPKLIDCNIFTCSIHFTEQEPLIFSLMFTHTLSTFEQRKKLSIELRKGAFAGRNKISTYE